MARTRSSSKTSVNDKSQSDESEYEKQPIEESIDDEESQENSPPPPGFVLDDDGVKTRRRRSAGGRRRKQAQKEDDDNDEVIEEDEEKPPPPGFVVRRGRKDDSKTREDVSDAGTSSRISWKIPLIILFLGISAGIVFYQPKLSRHFNQFFHPFNRLFSKSVSTSDASTQTEGMWAEFSNQFDSNFIPRFEKGVPQVSFPLLKAALRDIIDAIYYDSEPSELAPAVILILGEKGNRNVSCFVDHLTEIIAKSLAEKTPQRLNGGSLSVPSLRSAFETTFGEAGRHVIHIDQVNEMTPDTFLHLHPFVDHSSARYKKAVILLTGYTPEVKSLSVHSRMRDMDAIASSFLDKTFVRKGVDVDQVDSLRARLTGSVTAVLDIPGDKTVC